MIAHELIGMEWWQWQSHGDARPKDYPIKVVIYRGLTLAKVKTTYPVVPEKRIDYRYVAYQYSVTYLNKNIADNIMPEVTEQLKQTRRKIFDSLCNP